MRLSLALLSTTMALGVISCGGTTAPPATSDNNQMRADRTDPHVAVSTDINSPSSSGNPNAVANALRVEGDPPPRDAQFTLFCDAINGPNHVMTATAIKDRLMGQDGLRNWHILHTNDQSSLFYGYYTTFNDKEHNPSETARAQADLHKVEALKNAQGDRLFTKAIFLPINNPDPDAPAQWNLVNTPSTVYWSLQIAAFRGFPERKKAALEAVRQARNAGVEAYYFHGETISSVCIGGWPIDAVKRQDAAVGQTADPNQIQMYLSAPIGPIDGNMRDRENNPVTVQAPKLEILDPMMKKAIRDYPDHAVNYEVQVKTAKNGQEIRSPSFLVVVPHNDGPPPPMISLPVPKMTVNSGADEASNAIVDDAHLDPASRGKLRSLNQP